DNSAGTFTNTDRAAGPTDNRVSYGVNASRPVNNPNTSIANETGAIANGTGEPLVVTSSEQAVSTPVEQTGSVDNPQESGTALIWISAAIFILIGSIIGAIRISQPGGQL
ncbi:MAG TPA: hypothetical protein VFJ58_06320, partial [Armatimonadota bacterium]|nr:hypothetical protein [Armatimonadota bacterium]